MNNLDLLLKPQQLDKEIKSLCLEIEVKRATAERTIAIISLAPGHGQGVSRKMEGFSVEIADLENEVSKKSDEYVVAVQQAGQLIKKLSDGCLRCILEMRYLNFKSWPEIADAVGYTVMQTNRKHEKALKLLCDVT